MNAPTTKIAVQRHADQIALLRNTARTNYEVDGGMMAETYGTEEYDAAILEHKTAARAWKAHTKTIAAAKESMDMQSGEDEYPARATDKQVKTAQAKAALKVGKPKHKPDAAQIAKNNVESGKTLNTRQEADAEVAGAKPRAPGRRSVDKVVGKLAAAVAKAIDVPVDDIVKHVKPAPAIPGTPYHGPMLALRDRLKAGTYKKAANGQPSCGDAVAQLLGVLEPVEVIAACLIALDVTNPYLHLNIGQQSMNLRNKLRGAMKRGEFGEGVLREAVEVVIEGRPAKASKA